MTIYKNKVEYVRTDWFDVKTIKPSEIKKTYQLKVAQHKTQSQLIRLQTY